jgi:hypothetical protein
MIASNSGMIWPMAPAARWISSWPGECIETTLLVMQPTLKWALQVFSAATIRGRSSPDSFGSTSAPRIANPSAVDSSRNSWSKRAVSTSLRSNSAQALS